MFDYGLGRFGDRRLEKGGPCCMRRLCRVPAHASVDLAGVVRRRFGLPVFYATTR